MKVDITIIIVNWKVRDLLRQCLTSLRTSAGLRPDQMQIIVVDNHSEDGSVEMVRTEFPEVALIANADNPGFGRANNQALPISVGSYLLLLNPDTVVFDGAINKLLQHLQECPDVAAMGCRLLNADRSLQRWTGGAFPRLWNVASHYLFLDQLLPRFIRPAPLYLDRDATEDIEVDWVSGACMILRVSMLNGTLFNPAFFMYGEDMELCHRLKQAGHRVVYSPVASIIHYQGASMRQQQGDVLLSSLKGPRQFYRQMRSAPALWWFDRLTILGFALRCGLYSVASWVRPRAGFAAKAASSKDLMARAWRIKQT
jgi:N-acetylglucosaminyl-diphospho-decaprenol L-rhamnosyltransferase